MSLLTKMLGSCSFVLFLFSTFIFATSSQVSLFQKALIWIWLMTPGYIIRVYPEGRSLVKMVPEKKHCLKTAHRAVQEKDDPKITSGMLIR